MFLSLVRMELLKIIVSKRLLLALFLVLLLSGAAAYNKLSLQNRYNANLEATKLDYYQSLQRIPQVIEELEKIPERSPEQESSLKASRETLEFLQQEGEPTAWDYGAFDVAIDFFNDEGQFFLPLLILLIAADLFSDEFAIGTIRLIFSSPTERWRFYAVKLLSGVIWVLLLVLASCPWWLFWLGA